jgi:hypothetical protein
MRTRLVVAALTAAVVCGGAATASAEATRQQATSASGMPDVTEAWSSPGAVWIARQLRQVNPRWGLVASDVDTLANEWCSPYTPTAIQRLLFALPGADLRALPALSQLVQALRASCYYRGQYSGQEIDYWTFVTAENLMTFLRTNVQRQARAERSLWRRPAPVLPAKVAQGIRLAVPTACRAVSSIASSWMTKVALRGVFGWTALAGLSVAKAACPAALNSAISRLL